MANTKQTKASPGGTEETSSASLRAGSGCQDSGGEQSPKCVDSGREQDRYLPVANILRIMKKGLPSNAKIAKDAKDTMQLCVSEFISFITSEASEKCLKEKRKTINGDDLLLAIATLGFEDFIEPLKDFLQKYREFEAAEDARREAGGSHPGTSRTMEHQNACQPVPQQISLTQGMNFVNPQVPQQGPLGQGMDFLNPQVPQQGSLMQGMDFLNPQIPQQDPLVQNMDFLNSEALPPLDGDWRAYDPFSKPSKESDGWKVDESLWCMLKTFQTLFQRVV